MRSFTENRPNQLSLTDTAKHHTEQSKLLFYDTPKHWMDPPAMTSVSSKGDVYDNATAEALNSL